MLLTPEPGLIIWVIITFLLVLFVLSRTVWKPLLAALDAREKGRADALSSAEKARDEAQAAVEEHKKVIAAAEEEGRDIVAQARDAAEKVRQGIVDEARQEAQQAAEKFDEAVRTFQRAFDMAPEDQKRDCKQKFDAAQVALKQSKEKNYYKILEVPRTAKLKDIKKSYRDAEERDTGS